MIVLSIGAIILKFLLTQDPPPLKGVYQQPGKWYFLKFHLFKFLMYLRKRQNEKKTSVEGETAGYGMRSRSCVEEMDRAQALPLEHPKAVDAVYFNGANKDGFYFVAATARRHENLVQTLLYLRVPALGLLELPSLPDTSLYTEKELSFSAGGLQIEPVEAMKKWRISYKGKMRLTKIDGEKAEEVYVCFVLDWTADTTFFDFDTDLCPDAVASGVAREKWSRAFFDQLKQAHQTHYEQFGTISGEVDLGAYGVKEIQVRGLRDHSYGNLRDWADLHRYCIQYISLEDGSYIAAGLICMPRTMSRLPMGYVFKADGSMEPLSSIDLEFSDCGDDGKTPKDFCFHFVAGGEKYSVNCHLLEEPIFYMGFEWEARIHERMCTFTVNGKHGWGISEWDYRNRTGRPELYKKEVPKF